MPAIKDRNSGEVIEIVDTREMGWCVGGWWLVTKDGYEVASYDIDFPQSPNRRENARYEALPAETQSNNACSGLAETCAKCGSSMVGENCTFIQCASNASC